MRIAGLEPKETPWTVRPIYFALRRLFGRILTPYTVLARRSAILWAAVFQTGAFEGSKSVEGRLKRLVSLRAAQMIGCPF